MGSKVKPRPIVVKFSHWKQKERVLRIAREKKPKGIMFYPDMAKRTLDRRTEQIPDLIEERKKGKIAYFVMDQLVVRDKEEPRDLSLMVLVYLQMVKFLFTHVSEDENEHKSR